MAALRIWFAVLALSTHARGSIIARADDLTLDLEPQLTGGFYLVINKGDDRQVLGHIGRTLASTYVLQELENGVALSVGPVNLTLTTFLDEDSGGHGVRVSWNADIYTRLEDCFDFGTKHWYGGPEQLVQNYPIETASLAYTASVSSEVDNGAIGERYWVNSAGEYYYVHSEVPLFVDYHNLQSNHLCFGAQIVAPYSSKRTHTELTYDVWFHSDVKAAHKHAVATYLGKPSDVVDYRMIKYPVWSTWVQFFRDINEENLMDFANTILSHGFENAQFEIDDKWDTCYGSFQVDENKFSNFTKFVQDLKSLGFRVALWTHPFINKDCEPWYSTALDAGYLVLNEEGSPDTDWWNANGSVPGIIDFTNPEAADWWSSMVREVQLTYGIDSFKFDAGETSFLPQIPAMNGEIDLHPHVYAEKYVKTCAEFGNMIEVRTGFRTQSLPIFVRMVDRDSNWGLSGGLSSVITTTLQMNLNGYTFVLPDMIGGNGLSLDHPEAGLPTKELFIRWVQANTFLPVMQYSYVPWQFDDETVEISKKYTELHAQYADEIFAAIQASVDQGNMVNAPIWWLDPTDEEALVIWDEYLLGENILVAPVLTEGAVERDIYLPTGTWLAEGDPEREFEGPIWLRGYSAPLDTLPFFVRDGGSNAASTSAISAVLVLLVAFANLF